MTGDQRPTTSGDAARPTLSAARAAASHKSQVASHPYSEDQLLPISAVSQYAHCHRRCALIYMELIWTDNLQTAEGRVLHEKTDKGKGESRGDIRILRSLRLRSLRLGITGIADVVELHRVSQEDGGIALPRVNGFWRPFPVEFKRGTAKNDQSYRVQLCAQALCLEEMLNVTIPEGALFSGKQQHRRPVVFDNALREETECACRGLHELFASGITPPPVYGKWCESCSLIEECQPRLLAKKRSARKWLEREMERVLA
jgi:CRISPR-associated exonuclease Cas4